MQTMDLIWTFIGFVLTLLVFSYLLGDHFLFRLVTYILVGVTAGYVASVVVYQVLWPRLVFPLLNGSMNERIFAGVPLILGLLLLTKLTPRMGRLGNLPMGFLVGMGVSVAIGGAVLGTLFGQVKGMVQLFDLNQAAANGVSPLSQMLVALVAFLGTVTTLVYFQFGARSKTGQAVHRPVWVEMLAGVGQIFIAITLGALFAGVMSASIAALIDRMIFIKEFVQRFL
jgi:hypothetical protein